MATRPAPDFMNKLLTGIIAVIFIAPLIATATPSPLLTKQKIDNLETILSHASKKSVDKVELDRIHKLLEEAEVALKAEDPTTAETLYSQAWNAYQAAMKFSQTQGHKATQERTFATRTATVKALLKQLEEIDKGSEEHKSDQIEGVKFLLAQAESAEDPANAQALVNQAYFMMKILLKDARNGKTLTFDHTFATPALKYADEAAYNDMHFGLLDTALKQLRAQADAEYNELVNNAKKLREKAEEAAEHSDYESATRDLALSTIEIKKALKHIGLAVPGI